MTQDFTSIFFLALSGRCLRWLSFPSFWGYIELSCGCVNSSRPLCHGCDNKSRILHRALCLVFLFSTTVFSALMAAVLQSQIKIRETIVWIHCLREEHFKIFYLFIPLSNNKSHIPQKRFLLYVNNSFIHNSWNLETTQMSLNQRMDKGNVAYLHNWLLLSCRKNHKNDTQMDGTRKEIILSDATQAKKEKHGMCLLINGY